MSRRLNRIFALVAVVLMASIGCQPLQPAFFFEDGDLSHYVDVAQEIEYPDTYDAPIDEVTQSRAPLTLDSEGDFEFWDLSLEKCTEITLSNSQVIRSLGGGVLGTPEFLARLGGPENAATSYDAAAVETRYGVSTGSRLSGGNGVESALSEFDADFSASTFWEKQDRPQNALSGMGAGFFPPVLRQDVGTFTAEIAKITATGGRYAFRNNTTYDFQPSSTAPAFRALPSVWNTDFEAEARHPLLQGAGTMYNRIAGPFSYESQTAGAQNQWDGVMIARINVDLTLAEFECRVRDLLVEVENAYQDLYFRYRDLDAKKAGQRSARETWEKIHVRFVVSSKGGEADKEAQARSQYFLFRSLTEQALTDLYASETRLRYLMGIAVADGRLIRPSDELTTARVTFDWTHSLPEAVTRRCEVRRQKWEIKKRELELIAAKNHLLPRLDAVGLYRFRGMGNDLLNNDVGTGLQPTQPGSSAIENLFGGDFQEWQLGLQMSMPIGFRRQLSGVRHQQLLLSRDKAVLEDLELEISHQLGAALRDVSNFYQVMQTNFNRRVAADNEVEAVQAAYTEGTVTLDLVLDAQRRRADAEIAYYRSLVDYNVAIMQVHRYKGSLLEYNGVFLAEGPWPKKAYFDALRRARERDAAHFVNFGFTRPKVISRGPYGQHSGMHHGPVEGEPNLAPAPEEVAPGVPSDGAEELPTPAPSDAPAAPSILREAQGPVLRQAEVSAPQPNRPAAAWKAASSPRPAAPRAPAAPRGTTSSRAPGPVLQLSFEDFSKDKQHETVENRTPRRAAAPASGWKRAQH
jgi:outer membrane protein TolC